MKIDTLVANPAATNIASNNAADSLKQRFLEALQQARAQTTAGAGAKVKASNVASAAEVIPASEHSAANPLPFYNPVSPTPLTVRPTSELAAIILGLPIVSAGGPGNTSYRCSEHAQASAQERLAAWEAAGCPAVDADGNKVTNRGEQVTGTWA